jgi:hypothetical protein
MYIQSGALQDIAFHLRAGSSPPPRLAKSLSYLSTLCCWRRSGSLPAWPMSGGEARGPLDVMNTWYPRIRMRV